jgi:hypothetical protein
MPVKKAAAKKAAQPPQGNNPPRDQVKPLVIRCIYAEAILNRAHIHKPDKVQLLILGTEDLDLDLEEDLLIGGTRRAALSQCYDYISHSIYHGGRVTPSESRDAETVGAAIELVHDTSNDK